MNNRKSNFYFLAFACVSILGIFFYLTYNSPLNIARSPGQISPSFNDGQGYEGLATSIDGATARLFPFLQKKPREVQDGPIQTGIHIRSITDLLTAERKLDTSFDLVVVYSHWGNENAFPERLARRLEGTGKTIVVFWNAMDYRGGSQERFSYEHILRGEWDKYIEKFARDAAEYEGEVFIIPFEEVNGNWTPWSGPIGGYTHIDEYKRAFIYLREKFRQYENLKFGWVVNYLSVPDIPENQIENFYPGDEYVDFIGVNGFNFADPWISFDDIFNSVVTRLELYEKPLYITSTASADGELKDAWVRDFLSSPLLKNQRIEGWMWFNENKEHDWRFWSDRETEAVFKEALSENDKN